MTETPRTKAPIGASTTKTRRANPAMASAGSASEISTARPASAVEGLAMETATARRAPASKGWKAGPARVYENSEVMAPGTK